MQIFLLKLILKAYEQKQQRWCLHEFASKVIFVRKHMQLAGDHIKKLWNQIVIPFSIKTDDLQENTINLSVFNWAIPGHNNPIKFIM